MFNEEDKELQKAIQASLNLSKPIPKIKEEKEKRSKMTRFVSSQIQICKNYQVYPILKTEYEFTGKIILPQYPFKTDLMAGKAFGTAENPVIFKLSNVKGGKSIYLGLQEFHHDDSRMVLLPYWAIKELKMEVGEKVKIENMLSGELPKGKMIKVQPLESEFVKEVEDPRQLIENFLNQHVSAISKDQLITIPYKEKEYELYIKEIKDVNEVSILVGDLTNTNVILEFEASLDEENRKLEEEHKKELETEQAIEDGKKATELLKDHSQSLSVAEQMRAINMRRAADYARSQKESE